MNKYFLNKFIPFAVVFLCLQSLSSQVVLEGIEQSSAYGKAQSSSFIVQGGAGYPTPIGGAQSASFILQSGIFPLYSDSVSDYISPLAPSGIVINPDEWSRINSFTINWTNPESDENIAGAYYKIGSLPTANDDGVYVSGAITSISEISVVAPGDYPIYIWLRDIAGNASHQNYINGRLRFDNSPPVITHTPLTLENINTNLNINALFSDVHSGFSRAELSFRITGASADIDTLSFVSGQAQIPGEYNTQRGVEYSILANDNTGNVSRLPAKGYYSVQAILSGEGGVLRGASGQPVAQHFGAEITDYRIFSVPFILDNKTPASVFEDDLGAVDHTKWRCFGVENGNLQSYNDIRTKPVVTPFTAFLLLVAEKDKVIDSGSGVSPRPDNHYSTPLSAGWNLIGNPFDFDIPMDSLHVNGGVPEAHYLGEAGWSVQPDVLKKWQGVAIYSETAATLTMGVGEAPRAIQQNSGIANISDWAIRMKVVGETSMDMDNYAGVISELSKSALYKWHEPLKFSESVSLRMTEDSYNLNKTTVQSEQLTALFYEPNDQGYFWELELLSGQKKETVEMQFESSGNLPDSFLVYLLDRQRKTVQAINPREEIIMFTINDDQVRNFRLIVGKESYAADQTDGIALIPTNFELMQNFPNPFNPSTTISFNLPKQSKITLEIYNVLGQKIRTLLSDVYYDAGYHSVVWQGVNDNRISLSSGMYLIRMQMGNEAKYSRAVLLR